MERAADDTPQVVRNVAHSRMDGDRVEHHQSRSSTIFAPKGAPIVGGLLGEPLRSPVKNGGGRGSPACRWGEGPTCVALRASLRSVGEQGGLRYATPPLLPSPPRSALPPTNKRYPTDQELLRVARAPKEANADRKPTIRPRHYFT